MTVDFQISVLITSYNQKACLVEAIESVLAQTLKPIEIIVADDASTDGSQEIIAMYERKHRGLIKAFCHASNIGVSKNRNFALDQAKGNFVAPLDGDDRFVPLKLEMEVKTLRQHLNAKVVYSNIYYIDENGNRVGQWMEDMKSPPSGDVFSDVFLQDFPRDTFFRLGLVESESMKKAGYYDPVLNVWEDWDLAIRLAKHYQVAYCPHKLLEYRKHNRGLSSTNIDLHFEAIRYIYSKNRSLLNDLPTETQRTLKHSFLKRMAKVARRAAREARDKGKKAEAIRYWIQAVRYAPLPRKDIKFLSQIVLSDGFYNNAKKFYADFRRHFV